MEGQKLCRFSGGVTISWNPSGRKATPLEVLFFIRNGKISSVFLLYISVVVAQFQINGSVQKGNNSEQRAFPVSFTGWRFSAGVTLTGETLEQRIW